ncbi:hypothetical protein SteCoe_1331 [Stentor coeruleus]|uniref:Protein kinase domain-containing protein n=1 Tax=Stentor coeruleus TaxID=5963 RepID=A0A1R2D225_9CILI|nr:hypothetical protein SteCoe_1331 [Stentor coeruleus]
MSVCSNQKCNKPVGGFFQKKLLCKNCKNRFCPDCFFVDPTNMKKSLKIGYCWEDLVKTFPALLNSRPNPPSINEINRDLSYIIPISDDPERTFNKIRILGKGTSGTVYQVYNRETNNYFALKEICLATSDRESIIEEFAKSVLSPCQNIVECYALYKYNDFYAILLELMDVTLTDLFKYWVNRQEYLIAYILREVTRGLCYIHMNYNIHRDIKSENIFINNRGNVKIGDFGLSAQLTKERDYRETFAGSPLWTAPEILNMSRYDESIDIWSLGIVCFEIAEGKTPYSESRNMVELRLNIERREEPNINSNWSPQFKQFVEFCLRKIPGERKKASELLETEFLRNVNEAQARQDLAQLIFYAQSVQTNK